MALVVVALFLIGAAVWTAGGGSAAASIPPPAVVEHTFVVSQERMRSACKETVMTVVNGQFPGPVIEVTEGDTVVVHVVNKSPHGITIHWHGVKQRMNCWNDGVGMITQCPIQPNSSFTYRFNVVGQEGTLWWHAHVTCLRGTVHGALVIRPRGGPSAYPFPKPDKEVPIIIGEWWEMGLDKLDRHFGSGMFNYFPVSATINGNIGDLYNCSGTTEDNYILNVDHGKTYLLRIVNAALLSEYYLKIAGHKFMVVAADANYVKPYTTDTIMIAPGETVDALVVGDAPAGRYYMVALANQPPKPDIQIPMFITRGVVQYYPEVSKTPVMPEMPNQHDMITPFDFRGNLTSLPYKQLPAPLVHVNEHLFLALALGAVYRLQPSSLSCNHSLKTCRDLFIVTTMNNISFELPTQTSLLEAHYHGKTSSLEMLQELPDQPPRPYNYTDKAMIPAGMAKAVQLLRTSKATVMRRFRFNSSVEIVFQSTALQQAGSNPMHLHGQDFFVLAQGFGNYDAERDVKKYNLVDPPLRNTILVPPLGWAAIRFVTDNPGVWFLHCHYEFHVSSGMAAAFVVENGPTSDTSLPPPPADFPICDEQNNDVAYE